MAVYFFDVDDGDTKNRDDTGHPLSDRGAARWEAIKSIAQIAEDRLPDGDQRDFVIRVREGEGPYIFEATLSLHARWLNGQDR